MVVVSYPVSISSERCEGCGLCADVVPEVFVLGESPPAVAWRAEVSAEDPELVERLLEAQTLCPTGAITVDGLSE